MSTNFTADNAALLSCYTSQVSRVNVAFERRPISTHTTRTMTTWDRVIRLVRVECLDALLQLDTSCERRQTTGRRRRATRKGKGKGKGKGLDTCYSAAYMSQTRYQQRFYNLGSGSWLA